MSGLFSATKLGMPLLAEVAGVDAWLYRLQVCNNLVVSGDSCYTGVFCAVYRAIIELGGEIRETKC